MATSDLIGGGNIEPRGLEEEMRSSYLDYAMSVIVGRALPDVRDGLKPVHRRVLFAMNEAGLQPNRGYAKCARIVVDRTEVALAVDERVAHREVLCQPHERVVDRRVAVRVVAAHHVADDARGLAERAVGLESRLVHREEHPAVHGLEAVAHVG